MPELDGKEAHVGTQHAAVLAFLSCSSASFRLGDVKLKHSNSSHVRLQTISL